MAYFQISIQELVSFLESTQKIPRIVKSVTAEKDKIVVTCQISSLLPSIPLGVKFDHTEHDLIWFRIESVAPIAAIQKVIGIFFSQFNFHEGIKLVNGNKVCVHIPSLIKTSLINFVLKDIKINEPDIMIELYQISSKKT